MYVFLGARRLGGLGLLVLGLGLATTVGCRQLAKPKKEPAAGVASGEGGQGARESASETTAHVRCTPDFVFPPRWPIAEASAAVEVELTPGARELAVAADSDNGGALLLIALPAGASSRKITLPLDRGANDDIEGMAWREGALFTLTSSGAVRRFVPDGKGAFVRSGAAYPIGAPPLSCPKLSDVNCGKNYEGLCLRGASIPARCVGYAASKQDNALYCLIIDNGKLLVDPVKHPLKLELPNKALSDCTFGTEGGPGANTLVVTTNVYGGSRSYVVDETSGALARIDLSGHVTNEAVALDREGALYQFMDDGREPSAGSRATCAGW